MAVASGCFSATDSSIPVTVFVLNDRSEATDVVVEVDGREAFNGTVSGREERGALREAVPFEHRVEPVKVLVRVDNATEPAEREVDLSEGRYIVVAVGPTDVRITVHEAEPAFA